MCRRARNPPQAAQVAAFADAYHIPLSTLKNGERGRRAPDAPAAAYLQAIARRPQVIRDALQHG